MKKKQGHLKSGALSGLRFAAMALIAAGTLMMTSPNPALAQDLRVTLGATGEVKPIVITPGFTMTVDVDKTYSDMVVGNPGVADVFPLTNRSLYIQGNAPGATNVSFYNPEKQLLGTIIVQVRVDFGELQDAIDNAVPSANVKVSNVNNRIRLSGEVRDTVDLGRIMDIARQYAAADDQVVNSIRVTDPQQVQLDVRILEVSRSAGRELGIGLRNSQAGGTNGTSGAVPGTSGLAGASVPFGSFVGNLLSVAGNEIDIVINTLEAKGLARRLANPTLITSNGVEANFTVGGEVPISISATDANGNVSTSTGYRDYGVKLAFRPVVLDNSMISLSVKPEVSDVDTSLNVNGQPAFISRKADTTVSLRDGQSFAIAGLLQVNNERNLKQVPWLGQIPVLGTLFRSSAFQKQETDLVIVVTPHLVRPATPGQPIITPMDQTRSSNDVEMFLMGMLEVDRDMIKAFRNGEGIAGPYGHIIDLEFDDALIAKK
jgi:pilus assembly protein CpaC